MSIEQLDYQYSAWFERTKRLKEAQFDISKPITYRIKAIKMFELMKRRLALLKVTYKQQYPEKRQHVIRQIHSL